MLLENLALTRLAYLPAETARAFKQEKWKPRVGDSDDHARILDYWVRRKQGLSEAELDDFYRSVSGLLVRPRLGRDYADPDVRRELIRFFSVEKVIRNAKTKLARDLTNFYELQFSIWLRHVVNSR